MPVFKYSAVDKNGIITEGTYLANEKSVLLQMIREKQQMPVKISEVVDKKDVMEFNLFQSIKLKDLAVFCRQFYTMINAGVTIIKCLDILQQQTENKKLRSVIKVVYESVQKGATLSEALKQHREAFPELLIHMVEAGEASGSLDNILERMAIHFEKENKVRNKIKSAMIYPIVLSIMATVVVIFLLAFVMPIFVGMFASSGTGLPLPTRIILALSNIIRDYWYVILAVSICMFYFIKRYIKSETGRLVWDRMKLRNPVVGGSVRKIVTSRFTRTLSTLLSSGMPLLQALEVVSRVVGNKVATKGILTAREEMRRGMDLAGPIKKIGLFPPMVDSMIRIGEESGTLDEILDKTANFYDDEVEVALQRLVALIEPLMIVIMAGIIGFIVISMAMPMFDMMKTVQ